MRKFLSDLNLVQDEASWILCDNQSAIAIVKNPVFHGKKKHFKIKYHFSKEVTLVHCSIESQLANILTKPLEKARFEKLRNEIDVHFTKAKDECC
ncbi:putative LRR receptor-like serine/threonine-protein kinase [Gossypium australe]|uniref:Putative LRR receptor-like serine/threonine-protein kinase n=1 Tax=Gossypium australe TaxID=47621 RepID=A0A5B6VZB4_9ROSI|nr:putative LRR receptor-like serine/threonine-protein kinase [Gossypium australe]